MKKAVLLFLVVLLLFGCKKDRLEGEKSILEGKWRWAYSIETKKNLTSGSIISIQTIPASNFSDTYEIEFLAKGCVHYLINNEAINKYRIVFGVIDESTTCEIAPCSSIGIHLNNKDDDKLHCSVNSDTLLATPSHLPLKRDTVVNIYTSYTHYIIKVN